MRDGLDRIAQMAATAYAFGDASARADWQQLAELSAALAPQLHAWAAAGALAPAERTALSALRTAHDKAAAAAGAALDILDSQLAGIRNNKDGYLAYALAGDTATA